MGSIKQLAGTCVILLSLTAMLAAQRGAGGRGNAGRGGAAPTSFPAQPRPPGDPALIARGNTLYGMYCGAGHVAELRGAHQGGPNLLRSEVVLNDQSGELIMPVVQQGRQ